MGTSNSYGGSKKQVWQNARQMILDLPGGGSGAGTPSASPEASSDDPLDDLWAAIGDALDSDDPTLHAPGLNGSAISLTNLMPWLGAGSGGGGGAGGGIAPRTGGGREGKGSRRRVTRSAARGGTVLGAAHALRRGDSQYLQELGLDLAELSALSATQQAAHILDAVLGEGAHPDEAALRRASLEALKEVLSATDEPDPLDSLRSFVANFVFEQALVELQRQLQEGSLATDDALSQEQRIRTYLVARTKTVKLPNSGSLQPRDLKDQAARLVKEVIKLLRSRRSGASE